MEEFINISHTTAKCTNTVPYMHCNTHMSILRIQSKSSKYGPPLNWGRI
jgi:hypothetical protein